MYKIFFPFLFLVNFLFAEGPLNTNAPPAEKQNVESRVDQINRNIRELQAMKLGYEGKAIRQENQAQNLQFMNNQQDLARKMWKLADANRAAAKRIQEEIDRLEKEKALLLEKQGL